jgi:hypothetical protein
MFQTVLTGTAALLAAAAHTAQVVLIVLPAAQQIFICVFLISVWIYLQSAMLLQLYAQKRTIIICGLIGALIIPKVHVHYSQQKVIALITRARIAHGMIRDIFGKKLSLT